MFIEQELERNCNYVWAINRSADATECFDEKIKQAGFHEIGFFHILFMLFKHEAQLVDTVS